MDCTHVLYGLYNYVVDEMREKYMFDDTTMDTHQGLERYVHRESIYDDVMAMYKDDLPAMLKEFPFRIKYVDERAVDTGGVCRDMYSYFWEKAYVRHFDGEKLLDPAIHPNTDMAAFTNLGTVLVHGFMVCGFVPVRLAFPIIAYVLYMWHRGKHQRQSYVRISCRVCPDL